MNQIARFEKVSFSQFEKDWKTVVPQSHAENFTFDSTNIILRNLYENIKLPMRGTTGSAGYDITIPYGISVPFGKSITIPTGLRCIIDDGWFLDINPRSGQGFKFGIRLANTRGIIDSDYSNADNEGHIMVKLVNSDIAFAGQTFTVDRDKAFCQGIFLPYGLVKDDTAGGKRTGGFGSTKA